MAAITKIEISSHPRTIPTKFDLIWFSSFRREDLNVIFYQNMPNFHNRHKSAQRKISQKNPEYMFPGWVPFKIVSDSPLHSRCLLLQKK
jgi:hypothetical protein